MGLFLEVMSPKAGCEQSDLEGLYRNGEERKRTKDGIDANKYRDDQDMNIPRATEYISPRTRARP